MMNIQTCYRPSIIIRLLAKHLAFVLAGIFQFVSTVNAQSTFPAYGIIHNSLVAADQKIMLGVNPTGNLNTPDGSGKAANNTLNQAKDSNGNNLSYVNSGSVGISYYWPGGADRRDSKSGAVVGKYIAGWYDSTSQGNKWESWSVGAFDTRNPPQMAWASVSAHVGQDSQPTNSKSPPMTVKSFVVDATSVKSTVWINDTSGVPMLEVTHLYGPTSGATNKNLFQGLVTITNISGGTLTDVRYRRSMDWDVIENVFTPSVDAVGVRSSYLGANYPRIWSYCDNGGEDNVAANPFTPCKPYNSSTLNQDYTGLNGQGYSSAGTGSSFDFQFGNLDCNESATFYIYYGAGESRATLAGAMATVGANMYSMGYDPKYPTLAYTFGFKGVSGTAVPPTLPTKVASLPGGSSTKSEVYQTYAPPVLGDGTIYQALFRYQKDKQWIGEIKRYDLDASGAMKTSAPLLASTGLKARAAVNGDFKSGGRSIWTVGYDSRCMASGFSNGDTNNFNLSNAGSLEKLLFNCPAVSNPIATSDLINFTRGLNAYLEEDASTTAVRSSVLGDTYHSEMVMVGAPNAPWSSDVKIFGKSEAYFRSTKGYSTFVASNANRRKQIYVGANDGMLHAFDLDLNERWAFIPPPVLPMLRNMAGEKGAGMVGGGKSNSIFTVDGPITVKDVYFYGESKWKTVLMGGLGWGGNAYYALDITDPDEPKHLFSISNDVNNKSIDYWDASGQKSTFPYSANCASFDYSKLGGSWSRPVIMLLPYDDGSNKQIWAAVFGGGYAGGASVTGTGTTSTFGAYAYAVALEPNKSLTTQSCGATYPVGSTGGHVITATPLSSDAASNIPNGVTAHLSVVTGDGTSLANYYGGIAYFTDLQGKLWKWNLSKNSLTDDNSGMFSLYQSFRAEATLANDRMAMNQLGTTIVTGQDPNGNKLSRLYNYFGTGDLTRIQRRIPIGNTINNRIYGVADPNFPSPFLSSTNQTVASFSNVDTQSCTVNNSWYANVWAKTGVSPAVDFQKIVGRASVYNKYVYFTAYQPEAQSCPLYGTSRLIEMGDTCQSGSGAVIGDGLATQPVIDTKGNIYIGVSNLAPGKTLPNGVDNIAKLKATPSTNASRVQYKSWREKRAY